MLAKECSHKLANEANWHCLRAAVQELEDEIERNRKDAERWRKARFMGIWKIGRPLDCRVIHNREADAYIDAAIAGEGK